MKATLVLCLHRKCVFVLPVCVSPHAHDQLNTKDADMEKALLSYDITIKVLVRQRLEHHLCKSIRTPIATNWLKVNLNELILERV